jgi:hypothetical protein
MKVSRILLVCIVVLAFLAIAGPASAAQSPATGCGSGFTLDTLKGTAREIADSTVNPDDTWRDHIDFVSSLDANGDGWVCWRPIGLPCGCLNVVDNNKNS